MKVKELLMKPEAWTQNADARTSSGVGISLEKPEAVSFCILGAVDRVYKTESKRNRVAARIQASLGVKYYGEVVDWNDDPARTHAEVLALCEKLDI